MKPTIPEAVITPKQPIQPAAPAQTLLRKSASSPYGTQRTDVTSVDWDRVEAAEQQAELYANMRVPSTWPVPGQALALPTTAPPPKAAAQAPVAPKQPMDPVQAAAPVPSFSSVHPSSTDPSPQHPQQPNPEHPTQSHPVPHPVNGTIAVSKNAAASAPFSSDSAAAFGDSYRRRPAAPFVMVYCCVMFAVLTVLTAYLALAIKQGAELHTSTSTTNTPLRLDNDTQDGLVRVRDGTEAVEGFTSELSTVDYSG